MNVANTLIYDPVPKITSYNASQNTLNAKKDILRSWEMANIKRKVLVVLTLGIGHFFLASSVPKEKLLLRIKQYKEISEKMDASARVIQRTFLKWKHQKTNKIAKECSQFLVPQVDGSIIGTTKNLLFTWWENRSLDLFSGVRGQIVWNKTVKLAKKLKADDYYVFLHAHSFPISLHLELVSHLSTLHQSASARQIKPLESKRKFRAPGVAKLFENTSAYFRSWMGLCINYGWAMDDNYRETIISCDAIPDNEEAYESAQHFFKSNKSIVDTKSSTGLTPSTFDSRFIDPYLNNTHLQKFAVKLFSKAREQLRKLPGYGMIRIIAIAKERLEKKENNYVWRSHAFGKLCKCTHTKGKIGHDEFVATIKQQQKGKYYKCPNTHSFPQYRILAGNLDKDPSKQIYTMDCLTQSERKHFQQVLTELKTSVARLVHLEKLNTSRTEQELLIALQGLDPSAKDDDYLQGVKEVLKANRSFMIEHIAKIQIDLSPQVLKFIKMILPLP